jgi:uncharacterized protein (TIGR00369 family)
VSVSHEELVAMVERARLDGDWNPVTNAIPYARFLGLRAEKHAGELLMRLTFSPGLVGNASIQALHGGTLGALLESAAIFELLSELETVVLPKTINVTIDYMRSGRAVDTWARATIAKHGRRVASVHAIAWQEDRQRPIASATGHFLVLGGDDEK